MTPARSLILTAHEVRAALAKRLRLVVRPVMPQLSDLSFRAVGIGNEVMVFDGAGCEITCPLGVPGTELRCKETWCNTWPFSGKTCLDGPCFKATGDGECGAAITGQRWRSPVTMPAWASRITLVNETVGVGRLGELTAEDVTSTGVKTKGESAWGDRWWIDAPPAAINDAMGCFADAWNARYAAKGMGFDTNCWIWKVAVKIEGAK